MAEIGTAWLTIAPSMREMGTGISKGMDSPAVRKASDDAGKKVGSRLSRAMNSTMGRVLAVGAGVAVAKFGSDSVKAFGEAEQAQVRLSNAFAKFPKLADVSMSSLQGLNAELARKTRFDDDATASGQAVLAQFNLTGQQVRELTPLLQDYAAKTGKDLPTAAKDLGKALLGEGRALKAVGIDFQDTGSSAGNLDQLMAGLRTQVGGFAEQEGKSAAGQAEIMRNQLGELQEGIGGALVPTLITLSRRLTSLMAWIDKNRGAAIALAASLGLVITALKVAANWTTIMTTATRVATVATTLFGAAQKALPIFWVIGAITTLVGAIVWLYNNNKTARRIIDGAWSGIKAAIKAVGDWFSGTLLPGIRNTIGSWSSGGGGILGTIYKLYDAVVKLPGKISSAAKGMWEGLKSGATSVINTVIGWLNKLIPGTSWDIDLIASRTGKKSRGGTFARGGITPGYTPGRDVHKFYSPTAGLLELSGGEPILRPEAGRVLGPAWVHGINAAARAGGIGGVKQFLGGGQAFAGGGVWTEAFKSLWGGNPIKTLGAWLKDKVLGLLGGTPGKGGKAGMGVAAMSALVKSLDGSIRITSGFRPGATTATGFPSYHGLGRAIDIVSPNMGATFKRLIAAVGQTAAELYYTGPGGTPGRGLRFGKWSNLAAVTDIMHRNHIHLAMKNGGVIPYAGVFDRGGVLAPGLNMVNNLTGGPERLSPVTSGDGLGKSVSLTFHTTRVTPRDVVHAMHLAELHEIGG